MTYIVEKKVPIQLKTGRWQPNTTLGVSYLKEVEDYKSVLYLAKESLGENQTVGITDDYDSYFPWTYNLNKYFVPLTYSRRWQSVKTSSSSTSAVTESPCGQSTTRWRDVSESSDCSGRESLLGESEAHER